MFLFPFISLLGMFFSTDSKSFVLNVFHRMLTLIPSLVMVSMLLLSLDRSLCIAVQSVFFVNKAFSRLTLLMIYSCLHVGYDDVAV